MFRRAAFIASGVLLLAACVDLFHSTDYTLATDAGTMDAAPVVDAVADALVARDAAPLDFCALDVDEATSMARRACALLAACQKPFGRNALGQCLERALPAIACKAARGQRVNGPARDYYRCLVAARSCADIERCVYGVQPVPKCEPDAALTSCLNNTWSTSGSRIDCPATGIPFSAEACIAEGQTCTLKGSYVGTCTGGAGLDCKQSGCAENELRVCADAGKADAARDDGFDCAAFGEGTCVVTDAGPSCVPAAPPSGAIKCPPTRLVTCSPDGKVAEGCASGTQETIDCSTLFQGSCHKNVDSTRAWDLARACNNPTDAGGCSEDHCGGGNVLTACVRGNAMPVDCAALLGAGSTCELVTTADGVRPSCTVP